jgi:hypothetical protein
MRLAIWLTPALALGIGIASCSDSGKQDAAPNEKTSKAVAEALTTGAKFDGGLIKSGLIPKATADEVEISEDDPPLELSPGDSALMSLDVENPDEADDPVMATLVQFEGSDDHVEVAIGDADAGVPDGGAGESGQVQTSFTLNDDVCETFCNKKFTIKMFQAIKLRGGGISKKIERTFKLDCTDDGDPDLCPKDDKADDGDDTGDDTTSGDDTGDDEPAATDKASDTLTSAMAAFNRALCVDCQGKTQAYCPTAPFPKTAAVDCVAKIIDDNADNSSVKGWANCVAAGLAGSTGALACRQSCDVDTACSPSAFNTAAAKCNDLPEAVQSGIDDCMIVPDAGTPSP